MKDHEVSLEKIYQIIGELYLKNILLEQLFKDCKETNNEQENV